ncbi:MAG: hypothetical protein ACOX21_06010 [Bacillota bacterium]|jgi:NAD dependent epimerase/dehydratase family enzyme
MSNDKSVKVLLPVLGIVFGSGVGILASMLYSFHIAAGIICGAAVGLLIGLIASILKGSGANGGR